MGIGTTFSNQFQKPSPVLYSQSRCLVHSALRTGTQTQVDLGRIAKAALLPIRHCSSYIMYFS